MAAKTYKLKINKSDGTYVETASFTIPDTAGTYSLTLTLSNGSTINAGNIVVGTEAKTYQLTLTLSDGSTINAGTFTTPAVAGWHTVWTGNEQVANISYKGETSGNRSVTLTNETLAGVDWSRPTKITGVATASAGGISGTSNSKDLADLELVDNESKYLVGIAVTGTVGGVTSIKANAEMRITRNASNSNAIVSASCERNVSNVGIIFLRLHLTKVEQYY